MGGWMEEEFRVPDPVVCSCAHSSIHPTIHAAAAWPDARGTPYRKCLRPRSLTPALGVHGWASCIVLSLLVNSVLGLLGRLTGRATKFSSAELLIVWVLTVAASGVPSSGLNRYLTPVVCAPYYHQTPENDWESKL